MLHPLSGILQLSHLVYLYKSVADQRVLVVDHNYKRKRQISQCLNGKGFKF